MSRNPPLYRVLGRPGAVPGLAETPFLGHLNLRGNAADPAFAAAIRDVLGVDLPHRPNTVAQADGITLYWLGPDEWQAQTPPTRRGRVLTQLRAALAGQHAAVTDVSDGQTVIVLDHPDACGLLSRGCPLDLHPSVFPVGRCAQTVIGKTGVLLLREADQRFAIIVRRSFAEYLHHLLHDAAALAAG